MSRNERENGALPLLPELYSEKVKWRAHSSQWLLASSLLCNLVAAKEHRIIQEAMPWQCSLHIGHGSVPPCPSAETLGTSCILMSMVSNVKPRQTTAQQTGRFMSKGVFRILEGIYEKKARKECDEH